MNVWRRLRARLATRESVDWLIVGLGNPGPRYRGSRHNIGRESVQALAGRVGARLDNLRFGARFAVCRVGDHRVCLAVAITFMNESGRAVAPLARFFQMPPARLLVAHDDLDLPLGTLRLRPAGGSGGHRGVHSVIATLGTREFPRVRIGVGRPPPQWDAADYVLAPFDAQERTLADQVIHRAADAMAAVVVSGLEAAMTAYNG